MPRKDLGTVRDIKNLASDYSSELVYGVGSYCSYNGDIYRCVNEIATPEVWDGNKWQKVKVFDEISEIKGVSLESNTINITFDPDFAGCEYKITNGTDEIFTGTVPEDLTVSVEVTGKNTVYVISVDAGNVKYMNTVTTGSFYGTYAVTMHKGVIQGKAALFGYRVKKSEPDPEGRIEYLYDAVGLIPARMDYANDKFNYGGWGDVWFVKNNYPVMLNPDGSEAYKLDPNDYSKKLDGTASDVANTSQAANAMSAIPLVWCKRYEDDDYGYFIASDRQVDETYKAYAHTGASSNINPYVYGPMFKGSLINGKLRSLSGQRPDNSRTAQQELDSAAANGAGWYIRTHSLNQLIADLGTLISKTDNSQTAFGQGHTNGGSAASHLLTTGALNTKGQFYGTQSNAAMKMFHMENWYADRWDRMVGLILDNNTWRVKMTPEGAGYNFTGDGYQNLGASGLTGFKATSDSYTGFIKNSKYGDFGRLLLVGGASDATYECDGVWYCTSDVRVAFAGGSCLDGSPCGSRCWGLYAPISDKNWHVGASLSYI